MSSPLTLPEVTHRTGQPLRRLRLWCATGRLSCERADGMWTLEERQIPLVVALGLGHGRLDDSRRVIALAVPKANLGPDVAERVERAIGLEAGAVTLAELALDGQDHVIATWSSGIDPDGRLGRLSELADELGADLLEA